MAILIVVGAGVNAQEVANSALGKVVSNANVANTAKQSVNNKTTDNQTLWDQPISTAESVYAIVSSYFHLAENGIFCADDFELTEDSTINSILFYGSTDDNEGEYVNGINLYFYTDADGVPAGQPLAEGSAFKEVIGIPYNSEFVTVEPGELAFLGDKIYHIDLAGLGESIDLPAGHYWVSVVFDLNLAENNFDIRWSWQDSENQQLAAPTIIVPVDMGGLYIPDWSPVSSVGFPVNAFAFSLYGENAIMSTSSVDMSKLQVFPNPAQDVLYIADGSSQDIQSINIINLAGQKLAAEFKNGKINVSHLSPGTYILQIKTSKEVVSKKFVKK